METLLFITLLLLLLDVYLSRRPLWLVGFIGGLSMSARPEGLVMFGLVVLHALLRMRAWRLAIGDWRLAIGDWRLAIGDWRLAIGNWKLAVGSRQSAVGIREWSLMFAAFALPIVPYVWFNWQTSGLLFPNTFYAKQAEYAELFTQHTALWHWFNLVMQTFIGAQVLLVLGCGVAAWLIIKERRGAAGLLLAWWLGLPLLYALRLPVAYQHARYEMPVIPMLVMLGVWGSARLYARLPTGIVQRVLTRVWTLTLALALLGFWFIGAQSLANDAATMDCLVVKTAQWLKHHTQPNDLIAVHDIGATGYYLNDRALFDVAGLITPDVIPFIRDEARLLQFLRARQVRYLVTNTDWHPRIIGDPTVRAVYTQPCAPVRAAGRPEMGVYRLD
jgi:hypothetical protein